MQLDVMDLQAHLDFEQEEADMEIENRMKNLMWTVSGDYKLDTRLDVDSFRESKYVSVYDAIKQGAFARFFDKNEFALDANVYWKGSTTIGGELTAVSYYTRMPHYPGDWKKGTLQFVPTTIREMGHPTVIRTGDEVTFIINSDFSLYKPVE